MGPGMLMQIRPRKGWLMTQWQACPQVAHHLAILSRGSGGQVLWDQWGQWDQWDRWAWGQVDLAGVRHLVALEDLPDHGGHVLQFLQG